MSDILRRVTRALSPALVLTAALLVGATGCQQQTTTTTTTTSTPTESKPAATGEAMKVGLITPGSVKTDSAWSGLAYEGTKKIEKELGATLTPPVEGPAPAEVTGAARTLAQGGDTLVFLHGSEYDDAATEVAKDFPRTTFIVVGGRTEADNLTPIQFAAGDGTYLAGMLAAGMSKSGKIACVGAAEIPIVKDSFLSFEKGAKALNPKVDVKIVFTGDEKDISKAKQQTQALLDAGVDVVMHNANEAGKGVAQAITEKKGTYFIGANSNQSDLATAQNLGSFVLDVPNAYLGAAKAIKEGKSDGKAIPVGLKDKAVTFQYNDKFAGKIPDDLKAKLTAAEADIVSGKVDPKPAVSAMDGKK